MIRNIVTVKKSRKNIPGLSNPSWRTVESCHVNNLYNLCNKFSKFDNFFCITDDPTGLDSNIQVIDLIDTDGYFEGYYAKIYQYNKELPIEGMILFLDIDLVPCGDLEDLWTYGDMNSIVGLDEPTNLINDLEQDTIIALNSKITQNKDAPILFYQDAGNYGFERAKLNTSIVRYPAGSLHYIYTSYLNECDAVQGPAVRSWGDQEFVYEKLNKKKIIFYPKEWFPFYITQIRSDWNLVTSKYNTSEEQSIALTKFSKTFGMEYSEEDYSENYPHKKIVFFTGPLKPWRSKDKWLKENYWDMVE